MISDELFYRVKENLNQAVKGPYCIDLIVSKACNLKCRYCRVGIRQDGGDCLSKEILTQFLNSAKDLQVKEISITSAIGEPTLFKNIEFLMKTIKLNGFLGSLLTNGSLLDLSFANFLKQIKWDILTISVDSFNPVIQYSLRPSFNKRDYLKGVLEFLQFCRLNYQNLCLNLNMVVNALNYRDVEEYFKEAEAYGVKNITLLKLVEMNKNYKELSLTQSQLTDFKNIIKNIRTPVSFNHLEWLNRGNDDRSTESSLNGTPSTSRHCYYHLYKMLIDRDGQVRVCNGNASEKTGFNINDLPLKEIYFELVKLYMSRRNNPGCYDICCSPIKTMNQEIDFRLSNTPVEPK